jgi:DNA polymerase III alpha subunit
MNIPDLSNHVGSFINEPLSGTVTSSKNMKTKTGKTMSLAKLGNDTGTVDLQSFDHDLHRLEGKAVTFTGKGMKVDEYNGYTKLLIGKATKITVDGEGATEAPAPAIRTASTKHVDDDFVPQTLSYFMGAALHSALHDPASDGQPNVDIVAQYAVVMYDAREKAMEEIRGRK